MRQAKKLSLSHLLISSKRAWLNQDSYTHQLICLWKPLDQPPPFHWKKECLRS